MGNPMLQQLMQNNIQNWFAPIKNMIQQVKNVQNPQAALMNLLNQNPNMQKAIDYVNQNGGDIKAAYYKLMNENGLDPDGLDLEAVIKSIFN